MLSPQCTLLLSLSPAHYKLSLHHGIIRSELKYQADASGYWAWTMHLLFWQPRYPRQPTKSIRHCAIETLSGLGCCIGLKPALPQVLVDHAQARTFAGLCGPSTERDSDGEEGSWGATTLSMINWRHGCHLIVREETKDDVSLLPQCRCTVRNDLCSLMWPF